MSSEDDSVVIGGGAPGEHCVGVPTTVRLRVALVEQELFDGARAAQEALQVSFLERAKDRLNRRP